MWSRWDRIVPRIDLKYLVRFLIRSSWNYCETTSLPTEWAVRKTSQCKEWDPYWYFTDTSERWSTMSSGRNLHQRQILPVLSLQHDRLSYQPRFSTSMEDSLGMLRTNGGSEGVPQSLCCLFQFKIPSPYTRLTTGPTNPPNEQAPITPIYALLSCLILLLH